MKNFTNECKLIVSEERASPAENVEQKTNNNNSSNVNPCIHVTSIRVLTTFNTYDQNG